jgi:hypothetical protein
MILLPLLLTAVCTALVGVIYAEIENLSVPHGADLVGAKSPISPPPLPADPEFVMPPEQAFAAALERPVFSPTRRPADTPGNNALPTTSADFSLIGVIISDSERFVLIRPHDGDRLERLHEGDALAGWSAVSISPDRVVFRRGAVEEEILLDYTVAAPVSAHPEPERTTTSEQPVSDKQPDQAAGGLGQPEGEPESKPPGPDANPSQ